MPRPRSSASPRCPTSRARRHSRRTGADTWRHGLSLFGDLKYPEGFKQFEYVNPNAPKGGLVRLSREGSFDTLNFAITKGTLAAGLGFIYDTLMSSALDEVASEYGLLAEAVRYPADWSR